MRHVPCPTPARRLTAWAAFLVLAASASHLAQAQEARAPNPYQSALPASQALRASADTDEASAALRQVNLRRTQVGLAALAGNAALTLAAERHTLYLTSNNTGGHGEAVGQANFSGADPSARMTAAGYNWWTNGEVVSAGNGNGPASVEALMEAIFHRFGMLRSDVADAGTGFRADHPTFGTSFTMDYGATAANRADPKAGQGFAAIYPVNGQSGVKIDFYSDDESPDPVPGANRVGYPVSLQTAASDALTVTSFTLRQGATTVPTVALSPGVGNTPRYAASVIPASPLTPGTTYTASFSGSSGGRAINQTWSFTTAPTAAIKATPASPCYAPNSAAQIVTLSGGAGSFSNVGWSNSSVISVRFSASNQLTITPRAAGSAVVTVIDSSNATGQFTVQVSSSCGASTLPAADRLMNWAESTYPRYFAPSGAATQTIAPYSFRYYATTNAYLGVANGTVYYMDAFLAPGVIIPVGSVDSFMPLVQAAGF
jgi:uncharacterized protein YkwD